MAQEKTYLISLCEMKRRKKAYTTLIVSLFFGIVLPLYDQFLNYQILLSFSFAILASVLIVSRILLFRSFRDFEKIKVLLTDTEIVRITFKTKTQYSFNMITGVWIKKTVRNQIREIKIATNTKSKIYITALENFNEFRNILLIKLSGLKNVKEFKEPIDFDHPFYYVFFWYTYRRVIYMHAQNFAFIQL